MVARIVPVGQPIRASGSAAVADTTWLVD